MTTKTMMMMMTKTMMMMVKVVMMMMVVALMTTKGQSIFMDKDYETGEEGIQKIV